jgi:hypothetical protein
VCIRNRPAADNSDDSAGAGFWVGIAARLSESAETMQPITNRSDCMTFADRRDQAVKRSTTVINGVRFATSSFGDGGPPGTSSIDQLFRTFRHGKCYELGTAISWRNDGSLPHSNDGDSAKVAKKLRVIVHSFRFMK